MPQLQHLRSDVPEKRPDPALLSPGQLAQNRAADSPGLFFTTASGGLAKAGPTHVGPTAPNSTPAGFAGNCKGEQWIDTSGAKPVLKTWDGTQWLESGGGASVSTSDTPPAGPVNGDLWFRTDVGQLYVWYDDGTSAQWVEANTGSSGSGGGGDVTPIIAGTGLTGGTITDTGAVALDTAYTDARYVNVTGDTMTGNLLLPTSAVAANTFQVIDKAGGNTYVPLIVAGAGHYQVHASSPHGASNYSHIHQKGYIPAGGAGAVTVTYPVPFRTGERPSVSPFMDAGPTPGATRTCHLGAIGNTSVNVIRYYTDVNTIVYASEAFTYTALGAAPDTVLLATGDTEESAPSAPPVPLISYWADEQKQSVFNICPEGIDCHVPLTVPGDYTSFVSHTDPSVAAGMLAFGEPRELASLGTETIPAERQTSYTAEERLVKTGFTLTSLKKLF